MYKKERNTIKDNMTTSLTFAVIYPLPAHLVSHILQDKKSIFAKYPTHETISLKLTSCKKLMLYISGANKEIAGEADIISIRLMTLSETILKYGSNMFLTEDELLKYSNGRNSKKMMVFELDGITPYPEPKALGHGITMVGEYMSKEEYYLLVKESNLNEEDYER